MSGHRNRQEHRYVYSISRRTEPATLYAARGRLIPFNSNSLTGSTFTAFSTFVSTRGLQDLPRLRFVA